MVVKKRLLDIVRDKIRLKAKCLVTITTLYSM